jgi:hypothetical protein
MRVDRGRLNWGVFFIALGAVPLAYHQGAVSAATLGDAWRLWPLIIVGIGLAFVLSRTPAFFLGGTVVAVCIGLIAGSALAIGPEIGCGGDGHNARTISESGSFDGDSTVDLTLQCGSARIAASADQQWHVTASNSNGATPQLSSKASSLRVSSSTTTNGWSFSRGKDDWQISLPTTTRIDLAASLDMGDASFDLASVNLASARFTLNLGSLHVDLTGAKVGTLSISTNLGAAYLTLDGASDLSANLRTNLGSLEVCLPDGLGVRLAASDSLSSSDFTGAGLTRVGAVWQTLDYDKATHKADLSFSTSLGSLRLRHEGGCK